MGSIKNDSALTTDQVSTQAQREAYEIPGKSLFIYKKGYNKDAIQHGLGVRHAIEGKIQEVVFAKDPNRLRDVGVEFRMVGKTFDAATLHILIFCAPDLEEPLQKILQLPVVIELQRSSRENIPRLDILVIPKPVKQTSDEVMIDACGQRAFFARHNTYCGSPVILRGGTNETLQKVTRKGTFGGVLKVTYGSGKTSFHGMTAGHTVEEMLHECTALLPGSHTGPPPQHDGFDALEWIAYDDVLGRVLLTTDFPGVAAGRSTLTHDWALFDVAIPLPNTVSRTYRTAHHEPSDSQDRQILIAEKPHFPDEISAAVQLLGATGGPRDGELSSLPARLWLARNKCFVDAYMLDVSHGDSKDSIVIIFSKFNADDIVLVREGDSGAWVVHSTAHHLYGHIVAINPFGEAYMIPALDTFENMRECLGAISVTLPTASDLLNAQVPLLNHHETEVATNWHETHSTIPRPPTPSKSTLSSRRSSLDQESSHVGSTSINPHTRPWSSLFDTERLINDIPFVQRTRSTLREQELIDDFLDPLNNRIPSFELQSVKNFFVLASANETKQRAWYWHTSHYGSENELPEWVSIPDLAQRLRANVR